MHARKQPDLAAAFCASVANVAALKPKSTTNYGSYLIGNLHVRNPLSHELRSAGNQHIGQYDYRSVHEAAGDADEDVTEGALIDVDILGHIFEQSITDLEQIHNELDGLIPPQGKEKHKTRRKKEGAFYTPAFITRYIVEQALGGILEVRFEQLRGQHADEATGTATKSLVVDGGIQ